MAVTDDCGRRAANGLAAGGLQAGRRWVGVACQHVPVVLRTLISFPFQFGAKSDARSNSKELIFYVSAPLCCSMTDALKSALPHAFVVDNQLLPQNNIILI